MTDLFCAGGRLGYLTSDIVVVLVFTVETFDLIADFTLFKIDSVSRPSIGIFAIVFIFSASITIMMRAIAGSAGHP